MPISLPRIVTHDRHVGLGEIHRPIALTAVEEKPPTRDRPAAVFDEPHQRQRRHRLAGAGFAHDAHGLARPDVEADVLDADDGAVLGLELDPKALEPSDGRIEHGSILLPQ
jgi:hypothetical protein